MGTTKIINVLKDDKFEELLDIVKGTDASEVVFVLPKTTKAFKSEGHFVVLADEAKDLGKSVAFLCSNSEVNDLAKKYNFDVLSTKTEPARIKITIPKSGPAKSVPVAAPVAAKDDDFDDDREEEEIDQEFDESEETGRGTDARPGPSSRAPVETPAEEEREEETEEEKAPYGTEVDESGDPVYDEEEEGVGEVITASARTRGMSDVIRPSAGRRVKVAQKDKRPIEIETRKEETDDIQSVWGRERTDNIWADISKSQSLKSLFFSKFKIFGKNKSKRSIKFGSRNFSKTGVRKSRVYVGIISATLIVALAFVVYITVGSAKIEIKPRSQALGTQLKVTMSPNFSSVDNSFNRIPGQLFTISKSASGEFGTTAEKDAIQKARGSVTIYNEYSTSPQPLIATTRLEYIQGEKESGFVFRTLQSVTVPGMKVENGVVTPGTVSVEVIADKAGQGYNISAGDFGIVTWREKGDTARYEKIYGRSTDSMRGGILGKAKVVSEFDYNNAKNQLTEKVDGDVNEALSAQSAGLELLTGIESKIDSVESNVEIDNAADAFTMTVNSSITTIGYKKEDLMTLIADHVEKTNGLMIVPDKLELSYKDTAANPIDNTFEVAIDIGGNAYAKIDRDNIAANLMGKNELQIKDYLSSIKDIDSAKVVLSPFWVKKIPKNSKKIDILLTY